MKKPLLNVGDRVAVRCWDGTVATVLVLAIDREHDLILELPEDGGPAYTGSLTIFLSEYVKHVSRGALAS